MTSAAKKPSYFRNTRACTFAPPTRSLDVERKIKKRMRQERMVVQGDHVAVAMSGGKDSAATLSILVETFGKRPDIKFTAITIDEGIEGYRNHSIPKVKELCDQLGRAAHRRLF